MQETGDSKAKKMLKSKSFEELLVWQKGHKLILEIYKMTRSFPNEELFGLTSQIRRSAISTPANIAEGFKRIGRPDKLRFLNISQASLEETRYYLISDRRSRLLQHREIERKSRRSQSNARCQYEVDKWRNTLCLLTPVFCILLLNKV